MAEYWIDLAAIDSMPGSCHTLYGAFGAENVASYGFPATTRTRLLFLHTALSQYEDSVAEHV